MLYDQNRYRKVYPFYRSATASIPAPCCELNLVEILVTNHYEAQYSDFIRVDPTVTPGGVVIMLPTATGKGSTKAIAVKNITDSQEPITVQALTGEKIDENQTKIMVKPYEGITLLSDGENWWNYSNFIEYPEYWFSTQEDSIFTTGSVAIRGHESGIDSPLDKGTDVFFYVSGSTEADNDKKSLFGGTVYISGTLIQGFNNHVTGKYSFASGERNSVAGEASRAEGYENTVNSNWSHAIGKYSKIVEGSDGSLAAGLYLVVSGSHQSVFGKWNAEGNTTSTFIIGTGKDEISRRDILRVEASLSSSPGYDRLEVTGSLVNGNPNCKAKGQYSHAEGQSCIANADYSHAEGHNSYAYANCSHAEGVGSETSTDAHGAHASGYYAIASGSNIGQNVVGMYNTHGNTFSMFVVGNGTSDSLRSDILRVNQSQVEVTGSLAVTQNVVIDGNLTVAGTTTTIDTTNMVVKDPVIGLGFSDVDPVNGDGDRGFISSNSVKNTAFFWDNSDSRFVAAYTPDTPGSIDSEDAGASISIDSYADLKARVITAMGGLSGSLTTLSDGNPYIVPGTNISTLTGSTGNITISTNILSRGVSDNSTNSFITIKSDGTLVSEPSLTFDKYHVKLSETRLTQGKPRLNNTPFIGAYSHEEGYETYATADGAHSEGYKSIARGDYSHSEGEETDAFGRSSHAEGYKCKTYGNYSHAEGCGTEIHINASAAHASGYYVVASGSNIGQNVVGMFNLHGNTTSLFIVGDGDNDANRSDVFRVNKNRVEVTGSFVATQGLSGSLTKLSDGVTNYLSSGRYITISTASNGQVTIATSGGTWNELSPKPRLNTTASVAIAGGLGSTFAAQDQGSDTYFFVSGSLDGASRSVFGGDTVTSGSIYGKNGLEIAGDVLEMTGSLHVTGSFVMEGHIVPKISSMFTLGTTDLRWKHMYTGDLHLKNERGDWTIIEERDYLSIVNNITGKKYKMMMEPIDDNN